MRMMAGGNDNELLSSTMVNSEMVPVLDAALASSMTFRSVSCEKEADVHTSQCGKGGHEIR